MSLKDKITKNVITATNKKTQAEIKASMEYYIRTKNEINNSDRGIELHYVDQLVVNAILEEQIILCKEMVERDCKEDNFTSANLIYNLKSDVLRERLDEKFKKKHERYILPNFLSEIQKELLIIEQLQYQNMIDNKIALLLSGKR